MVRSFLTDVSGNALFQRAPHIYVKNDFGHYNQHMPISSEGSTVHVNTVAESLRTKTEPATRLEKVKICTDDALVRKISYFHGGISANL